MEQRSTHVDSAGKLRMVDVSRKRPSKRQALASCVVTTVADVSTLGLSRNGVDPLHAARLAGIQGAKQTSNLIPLCHPLNVDQIHVEVVVRARSDRHLRHGRGYAPHRRRDGGVDGLRHCRLEHRRFVAARRPQRPDRRPGAAAKDRWQVR
jgi:hypothetical protein